MTFSEVERTDKLDAVGNTTAAIGKGFANGSAYHIGFICSLIQTTGIETIDVANPTVIAGLFIDSMLPSSYFQLYHKLLRSHEHDSRS